MCLQVRVASGQDEEKDHTRLDQHGVAAKAEALRVHRLEGVEDRLQGEQSAFPDQLLTSCLL